MRVLQFAVFALVLGAVSKADLQKAPSNHFRPPYQESLRSSNPKKINSKTIYPHENGVAILGPGSFRCTGRMAEVIGRMGGCTATLVSPPNAEVTAVVLAAHCGTYGRELHINGDTIPGFSCYLNKDYWGNNTAQLDTQLCFSKTKVDRKYHGCILSQDKASLAPGKEVTMLGRSADSRGDLWCADAAIDSIGENDAAMVLKGPNSVTPGDSGGPTVPSGELEVLSTQNHFNIVGVNSMWFGRRQVGSVIAQFNQNNMDFFRRAITRYQREGLGKSDAPFSEPQVCGVNYYPR